MSAEPIPTWGTPLRVLSYNVRSMRDDVGALTSVIRACEPDVVGVQEAPRFARWRSKCARLARESGLVVVTGGRPAGAMLLLCRMAVEVRGTDDVLLARTRGLHQRGLAIGRLTLRGSPVVVASMHLGLRADERRRHVDEIAAVLGRYDEPVVLAGDVNEEPGEPAWQALTERWQDAYAVASRGGGATYSSADPRRRIDGVFVDRRLAVVGCGVPDVAGADRASDHRPVVADLLLPP